MNRLFMILTALIFQIVTLDAFADERVIITTDDARMDQVERQRSDAQTFCSRKSEEDAAAKCKEWLAQQQKSLNDRLLTSHCSDGEISTAENCLYRARGEVKYVLRAVKSSEAVK